MLTSKSFSESMETEFYRGDDYDVGKIDGNERYCTYSFLPEIDAVYPSMRNCFPKIRFE